MARPLTIYTSGGVEKFGTKASRTEAVVKPLETPRSEGKIQRNPDGTTTIIYPDRDEEEMVSVQPELGPPTIVVKGKPPPDLIDNRITGNCIKAKHPEYTACVRPGKSMASKVGGRVWR